MIDDEHEMWAIPQHLCCLSAHCLRDHTATREATGRLALGAPIRGRVKRIRSRRLLGLHRTTQRIPVALETTERRKMGSKTWKSGIYCVGAAKPGYEDCSNGWVLSESMIISAQRVDRLFEVCNTGPTPKHKKVQVFVPMVCSRAISPVFCIHWQLNSWSSRRAF